MFTILKEKLWAYIIEHNPELMFDLQENYSVGSYLDEQIKSVMPLADELLEAGQPDYIVQEQCMAELTAALKPSKFLYIKSVIEEEFPDDFDRLKEEGTLTYEVINLLQICTETFNQFDFSVETEDNRHLRYAIIAEVHNYLL
ncbi:DUF1896 family protein [Sphingobacterium sp. PCS056]|uniref:DUF1896 family protein n=1 Tax=Sphingobacterium sp. PCS056 TaxID=2931400 RepID=UPI00200E4D45|nr:DUF1896 family protein [Sphingobacterium sp. PCS056]UPZ36490.1 DUF1896 family protein [Sphingobacterium sp. PCS056]